MNKRKITAYVLLLCLIFAFIPSAALANEIDTELPETDYIRYEDLTVSYDLNEDGTVNVNERWSMYCEGVPGVFTTKIYPQQGSTVSDVRVSTDEGAAYVRVVSGSDVSIKEGYYTYSTSEDGIQTLNIYNQTTDDYFNINITYTIDGAVVNHADAASFEYTIINESLLTQAMPSVTVNLIAHRNLEKFSDFMLSVYSNAQYTISPVNKSQTDFSISNLQPLNDVAVKLVLPLDLFGKNTHTATDRLLGSVTYEEPNYFVIAPQIWTVLSPALIFRMNLMSRVNSFPGGWAGIAIILSSPIVLLAVSIVLARRNSIMQKTKRPNRSSFRGRYVTQYPDSLDFASAARLLEHTSAFYMDTPKYFASVILSLYGKGYLNILSTKRGLRIRLTGKEDEYSLNDYEQLVLIFLENMIGINKEAGMDVIAEYMFRNCDKVHTLSESFKSILDENLMHKGFIIYDSNNVLYRHFTSKMNNTMFWIYSVSMMIFAGVCNIMWVIGKGTGFLIMSLFVLLIVVLITMSRPLYRNITTDGELSASRWNAFARYLNECERMLSEDDIYEKDNPAMLFIYATAFDVNKRALRYLNYLMPWVGEYSEDVVLQGTTEGQRYSVCVTRLMQFLDEFEKMMQNCVKLYESEKGMFYKQKSQKRIKIFEQEKLSTADIETN